MLLRTFLYLSPDENKTYSVLLLHLPLGVREQKETTVVRFRLHVHDGGHSAVQGFVLLRQPEAIPNGDRQPLHG